MTDDIPCPHVGDSGGCCSLDILTEKVEYALNHPLIQMTVQPPPDISNHEWHSKSFE